jgi:hypothetical protein
LGRVLHHFSSLTRWSGSRAQLRPANGLKHKKSKRNPLMCPSFLCLFCGLVPAVGPDAPRSLRRPPQRAKRTPQRARGRRSAPGPPKSSPPPRGRGIPLSGLILLSGMLTGPLRNHILERKALVGRVTAGRCGHPWALQVPYVARQCLRAKKWDSGLDFGGILIGKASKPALWPAFGRQDGRFLFGFPIRIRPKSGPEARLLARKHYRIT